MRLYDYTTVIRSKNAGPFTLTIDLFFDTKEKYNDLLSCAILSPEIISELYSVHPSEISVCPFERVKAIKITLSRPCGVSSGSPGDTDVYGSSQHYPLADLDLPPQCRND